MEHSQSRFHLCHKDVCGGWQTPLGQMIWGAPTPSNLPMEQQWGPFTSASPWHLHHKLFPLHLRSSQVHRSFPSTRGAPFSCAVKQAEQLAKSEENTNITSAYSFLKSPRGVLPRHTLPPLTTQNYTLFVPLFRFKQWKNRATCTPTSFHCKPLLTVRYILQRSVTLPLHSAGGFSH